ncbi:MAG: hypothetical protein M0020_05970 [Actinomycetota bacterium]|nr:hypothetical protein [Actinomycetota bacterium]
MAGGSEDTDPRPAVLILAPMRIELQPLVRVLRLRRVEAAGSPGRRIYRGTAGKLRLVATTAGIGTAASAAAAREMLDAEPFDRVVVCGVAGGIGPGAPVGSVIVPQAVRDTDGNEYRAHPLAGAHLDGTVLTVTDLVTDQGALARLAGQGVRALDMETAAVAAVCEERGHPWSAVRSISDRADEGTLDDDLVGLLSRDGSIAPARVLRYLAPRPWRAGAAARLYRDFALAARAAAAVTADACTRLGRDGAP